MAHQDIPPSARRRAKRMRTAMTPAERKLWAALRGHRLDGLGFRRQVPMGPYTADFYCAGARMVIEVDGGQHAESRRDANRDAWLDLNGIRTIRFWNADVMTNLDGVLTAILVAARGQVIARARRGAYPLPASPSRGEGKRSGSPNDRGAPSWVWSAGPPPPFAMTIAAAYIEASPSKPDRLGLRRKACRSDEEALCPRPC
ncbi:MAG: endonuclease domain-containing protein [Bauldia sp.]|nr:endonuclease domain-containing protein [Bauldia sp.]